MSATDRPWWATDDDAAGLDPDRDVDPLEAHRAARRGEPVAEAGGPRSAAGHTQADDDTEPAASRQAPTDDGSWWIPATEALTRLARDLASSATASPPRGLLDEEQLDVDTDEPAGSASEGPAAGRPGGGGDGGGGHRIDACGVCPICVGLRALGEARPDLVGHLTEAARQLALAVRTVVDAAAPDDQPGDATPTGPRRSGGRDRRADDLHRIDLDD
ncbi:hypothetical protein [Nitriliruptor alkaliphilus]|uniref:hypothetical protein n=1 Tax=Nitriliruptor alkaliphilus TaxID=427918 RepID=UPI000695D92F|nr:hypothetical protein [Nitriliruptor alkaliphilus]